MAEEWEELWKTDDDRVPTTYLNYSGKWSNIPINKAARGPSTLGEPLFPVVASYNKTTNTSRVGFSYMPPPIKGT